jgi:F0F1-type ATP synthase assembly protein I
MQAVLRCHKLRFALLCSSRMDPGSRQTFEPAGAGGILIAVTAASIAVGALIGWAAGSLGLGCLGGAMIGIPAGVYAVYRRYRGALS